MKTNSPSLTTQALADVQLSTGHLNAGMKKLVKTVHKVSNSKIVNPNIRTNFQQAGQLQEDFFYANKNKSSQFKRRCQE